MSQDAPKPRQPFVKIDPRWWSMGVVDGFNGTRPQLAVPDQFSYTSGRVEGQAAKEHGQTVDDVLAKYRVPYRAAHFRPALLAGQPPEPAPPETADALTALAEGRAPERTGVLVGALALKTLCDRDPAPSRDLLDAAAGLEILATGGSLDLDATGRARAARFAALVRQIAGPRVG